MVRSFVLAAALVLAGCGGDGEKPTEEPVCEAGRVAECPCEGGTVATQECKADGSAWGECECEDASTVPALACSLLRDQSTLVASDRCPPKHDMYRVCDEGVVKSGACYETSFGAYCCAQR